MKVIINGREVEVEAAREISYEALCRVAGRLRPYVTIHFATKDRQGCIVPGDSAPLEEGAIYNITFTGAA